jgi:Sigma-70 region 2
MRPDLEESFDAFVRAHGERFLRVAVLLAGSPTEAEDLLQASLVRLYRAWPRLDVSESAPDAYLRKILVGVPVSVTAPPASQVDNLGAAEELVVGFFSQLIG